MSKLEENNLRYQLNNAIDNAITEWRIINKLRKKQHRYPKIPEFVKHIILPTDLFDPFNKKQTDIRGTSVIRKLYKSFDVACIPITIPTEKANSIKQQIEIMIKLNSSRNFLKYYGISNTIDTLIMINEWAELGNLKEVYNDYNISWNVKIQIALDICRGICFMHENKILHHNLQCANIMMSGYCEPRITNFEYSYYMGDKTLIIPTIDNVINWAAPEQIENLVSYKYDTKCEVFSFGMLLWELTFERIPYQGWDAQKIKDHVLNNNRENIDSIKNEKVYEDYFEIVKNAWNQNPKDRDQFTNVFNKLEQLAFSYYKNGISLNLTPKFAHHFTTKPTDELEARAKLWIEDMIEKKVIKSIDWSEFKSDSVKEIGKGNFGISKSDKDKYHIVMEYADEGDLKHYLSNNFEKLDWNGKFRLALDITNGLQFLHKEKILHRDLHAKNIKLLDKKENDDKKEVDDKKEIDKGDSLYLSSCDL
ncbi:unnamed protein product [Rhizophagus irregularis]|nr:unnamed protein product [Rhizophagus irregularis]